MVLVYEIRDPSTLFFKHEICFVNLSLGAEVGVEDLPPHNETGYLFHKYNGTFYHNPYCKVQVYPFFLMNAISFF